MLELEVRSNLLTMEEISNMQNIVVGMAFEEDGSYSPLFKNLAMNLVFVEHVCAYDMNSIPEGTILSEVAAIDINAALTAASYKGVVNQWKLFTKTIDEVVETTKLLQLNDTESEHLAGAVKEFFTVLTEKLGSLDLDKINKRLGSLTPQKIVNAYLKSDKKRENENSLLDEKNRQIRELQEKVNQMTARNVFADKSSVIDIRELV